MGNMELQSMISDQWAVGGRGGGGILSEGMFHFKNIQGLTCGTQNKF